VIWYASWALGLLAENDKFGRAARVDTRIFDGFRQPARATELNDGQMTVAADNFSAGRWAFQLKLEISTSAQEKVKGSFTTIGAWMAGDGSPLLRSPAAEPDIVWVSGSVASCDDTLIVAQFRPTLKTSGGLAGVASVRGKIRVLRWRRERPGPGPRGGN
jgi:hypothetical protein